MDTTLELTTKDKFLQHFTEQNHFSEPALSQEVRKEAQQALNDLDFPTRKTEYWKYTRVGKIVKKEYQTGLSETDINIEDYSIEGLDAHKLVFVNGYFREDLSSYSSGNGLTVELLSSAKEENEELLKPHFGKYAPHNNEVFVAMNTAYHTDGVFVHMEKNKKSDKPVHIIHLNDGDKILSQPRHLTIAEQGAEVDIIQTYETLSGEGSFTNVVSETIVKENAKVSIDKVQQEHVSSFQIATDQAYQEKNSTYTINTITLDGDLVRNNLNIDVDGENCQTNLHGVYLLNGTQHVDNHTVVDHLKAHCESNELYKGVMNDKSTGVFNGKVFVRQDSQKINAFQSNANILMTDDAKVFSKPELEIYADDVKCSHGSTTGQLDEEAVFYLMTRGLPEQDARNLLLYAFAGEVLDMVKIEPLRKKIDAIISRRLGNDFS